VKFRDAPARHSWANRRLRRPIRGSVGRRKRWIGSRLLDCEWTTPWEGEVQARRNGMPAHRSPTRARRGTARSRGKRRTRQRSRSPSRTPRESDRSTDSRTGRTERPLALGELARQLGQRGRVRRVRRSTCPFRPCSRLLPSAGRRSRARTSIPRRRAGAARRRKRREARRERGNGTR
jgi:hypothetical protein